MPKIIAAINMTLDGFCDHTAGIADEELHDYFTELLKQADGLLYGRTTYQLMEDSWPPMIEHPTGHASLDEFAKAIDDTEKIVFSRTLENVTWRNSRLATRSLEEEVRALKQLDGNFYSASSPSIIVELTNLDLIDEYYLCIHPVILGNGLRLFRDIQSSKRLNLVGTKQFGSGALLLSYEVVRN